jgi:predicted dehydrogenase
MQPSPSDRRAFLKHSTALVGATILAPEVLARGAARSDQTLRVALVGCGGRGTGAAVQALSTAGAVKLVALADAFADRLETCAGDVLAQVGDRFDVPASRRFVGFDAYQKAIDCEVDVVLLATPPGFRPLHFEYAIQRGRHVFMEKPVAVDPARVRAVLAAAAEAKRKNLKVGVGLQRHHDAGYVETVRRVHAGEIGALQFLRCYWNSAGVWVNPRRAGQGEMEYQMRNWYYFNWLCGDHIVEQHIHNLDVCNWLMGAHPVSAQGQGGRQVRTGIDSGEIYDHHMVEFSYADGTKMLSQCRHIEGTWSSVSEHAVGTLGKADVSAGRLELRDGKAWRFEGERGDPYQVEHDRLFAAIREDRPHGEAENGAIASMTAILGRMATYSGQVVDWDAALASNLSLAPDRYGFDARPPVVPDAQGRYPIATPGLSAPY